MRFAGAALALVVGLMIMVSQSWAEGSAIGKGSKVAFNYTLTVDGKVADSSEGRAPLEYVQGDGKLIPGLTKQLEGMKAGDEKTVVVKPEDAYGNPNPAGHKEIPFTAVPKDIKPEVGMILQMQDDKGQVFPARVTEVKKDSLMIDLNHPLAGKTLTFKVKIVSVK